MIQDIEPKHLINEYTLPHLEGPDDSSLLICREDNRLWCRIREGILELPSVSVLNGPEKPELRYLIAVDKIRFYMTDRDIRPLLTELGFAPVSARELRYVSPAWLRFGALTGWQAAGWYQNNRFCGRCGAPMEPHDRERALVCPKCGNILYPKLCPVVIVGITSGSRILLTKYANRDRYARLALVAGFAEIGETIEQTVAREVMEETGLRVRNLRYYKSQPWAYSESLLFGFFCDVDGSEEVTVDLDELSTAVWTERGDIPDYGDEISLTYEMMRAFREGTEN